MALSKELKKIKKTYGERFMHLCRALFPTILENEGELYDILSSTFATNTNTLYEDIVKHNLEGVFEGYIYGKVKPKEKENHEMQDAKTPYQLLEEAGYELIECLSEEEIQAFKKYYAPGEELCTFHGGRLDRRVVFFAVKRDVEKIIRTDFEKPQREDEYGISVLGIQFNRTGYCSPEIICRYNHTVNHPNATYENDLDKIVPGLTQSFSNLLLQIKNLYKSQNSSKYCNY